MLLLLSALVAGYLSADELSTVSELLEKDRKSGGERMEQARKIMSDNAKPTVFMSPPGTFLKGEGFEMISKECAGKPIMMMAEHERRDSIEVDVKYDKDKFNLVDAIGREITEKEVECTDLPSNCTCKSMKVIEKQGKRRLVISYERGTGYVCAWQIGLKSK